MRDRAGRLAVLDLDAWLDRSLSVTRAADLSAS